MIGALLLLAACSGTETTLTGATTTTVAPVTSAAPTTLTTVTSAPGPELPPHTIGELLPLLDPLVAPLGYRVTRAALVDLGTYQSSPEGTHLAVYAEPLTPLDPESVAADTVPLAAALLPEVFLRWPGLQSFDICQEPYETNAENTAPPDTVLDLSRQTALAIDWETVTLADLLHWEGDGFSLHASDAIRLTDFWRQAEGASA